MVFDLIGNVNSVKLIDEGLGAGARQIVCRISGVALEEPFVVLCAYNAPVDRKVDRLVNALDLIGLKLRIVADVKHGGYLVFAEPERLLRKIIRNGSIGDNAAHGMTRNADLIGVNKGV